MTNDRKYFLAAARIWNDIPTPLRFKIGAAFFFLNWYKSALQKRQLDAEKYNIPSKKNWNIIFSPQILNICISLKFKTYLFICKPEANVYMHKNKSTHAHIHTHTIHTQTHTQSHTHMNVYFFLFLFSYFYYYYCKKC